MGVPVELLKSLPAATKGAIGAYLLDQKGRVLVSAGHTEGVEFALSDGALEVEAGPGRRAVVQEVAGRDRIVLTFDAAEAGGIEAFLDLLLLTLSEKAQDESDMESMQSSTLALLEEVSMVGEMLPKLPTAQSEEDLVKMCLRAILVAASVDRAMFVRFYEKSGRAYLFMEATAEGGDVVPRPWDGDTGKMIPRGDSLLWRAMGGNGGAILETVPEGGCLGESGSVESLARYQLIAVPVRYGDGEYSVTLGTLIIMDKRANSYSSSTEFGSQETTLASSVASVLGSALGTRFVTALDQEMQIANALQQQILPDLPPDVQGFEVAGRCENSGAVGGDYYDFLRLPDGRTLVVVADVSGHNLASGMIMVSARTYLHAFTAGLSDPGEVFDELSSSLSGDLMRAERFITAAGIVLAPGSRHIEIVNAGHNPTMIYRAATEEIEEIRGEETVLGLLAAQTHTVLSRELYSGDVVLLYTDGVTEATNSNDEMFLEKRLRQVLRSVAAGSASEVLSSVFGAVEDFVDTNSERDDASAVVIKVR